MNPVLSVLLFLLFLLVLTPPVPATFLQTLPILTVLSIPLKHPFKRDCPGGFSLINNQEPSVDQEKAIDTAKFLIKKIRVVKVKLIDM